MNLLVPTLVLIPLISAGITLLSPRNRLFQQTVTAGALISIAVISVILMIQVDIEGALSISVGGWAAPFGIALVVDRISAILVGVSALVLLGVYYFSAGQGLADGDKEAPLSIYAPTYLVLGAGVNNAFIAGDLFNLYVGFEILLVASYVLITLGGTAQRINAGIIYIVVSLLSSILFLTTIGLIYGATGTVNMADLSLKLGDIDASLYTSLNILLLVAFGIKAAVFPLAFWLPDSYPTAPAPVTAVFAGLLTKVGVYAIIRTQTLLFRESELNTLLAVLAAITMVVGILGAVAQLDIKRMLSFVLVSHIGYLIFGIAIDTEAGYSATTFYIVHHIVVQTTLFIAVGLIERRAATTSLIQLGGLLKIAPLVAVITFLPLLNLGGIPPFSGFIGKVALFEAATAKTGTLMYLLMGVGAFVSLVTLYVLARAWAIAFWRPMAEAKVDYDADRFAHLQSSPEIETNNDPRNIPRIMTGAAVFMVILSLSLTVFAGPLYAYASRAGANLADPQQYIEKVLGGTDGGSKVGDNGE
ncbi:MAG TPA: Na+/H+ antiporter subunit D [Microbacteriaceae bacterium]|nr:Na+/H+ antiporter subunit D [Microbacteriaceae bacterium]